MHHQDSIDENFLSSLAALSPPGLTVEEAREAMRKKFLNTHSYVYIARENDRIIGTATLLIEPKIIHAGGIAGHIEDVAIHEDFQGKGVGYALIKKVVEDAKNCFNCYKVILDCDETKVGFYEKNGFVRNGVCMRIDL